MLADELPAELSTESLMKMKKFAQLFEDVLLDKVCTRTHYYNAS